jgi:hypothetical protein
MSMQQQPHCLTVGELIEKWRLVGEAAEEVPLELMPPWADICFGSPLRWKRAGGLIDRPFRRKNFGYSGVYRLYGVASEDGPGFKKGWPGVINRACGTDVTGTLYIGRARRLSDRLNAMRRALLTGRGSHDVPSMLRYLMRLHQAYPSNKLKVALLRFANYKRVESDLIDAYVNSFGELPPLNIRLGDAALSDDDE